MNLLGAQAACVVRRTVDTVSRTMPVMVIATLVDATSDDDRQRVSRRVDGGSGPSGGVSRWGIGLSNNAVAVDEPKTGDAESPMVHCDLLDPIIYDGPLRTISPESGRSHERAGSRTWK